MSSEPTTPGSGEPEIRLLLLGKVGSGKSSVGNTILGQNCFKTPVVTTAKETNECELKTGKYKGFEVKVLDTPGCLYDKDTTEKEKWLTGIQEIYPGPHAIIWVLKPKCLKKVDVEMLKALKEGFKYAYSHTIFVLTLGDKIKDAETSKKLINLACPEEDAKFLIFNNKLKDEESKQQAEELLDAVIEMKKKNDIKAMEYYSNDRFEKAVNTFFEELSKKDKSPKKPAEKDILDLLLICTLDVADGKTKPEHFIQKLKALASKLMKK